MLVAAKERVGVTVVVDGRTAFAGSMWNGERKSFHGTDVIHVRMSSGRSAVLTVNDHDVGKPGVTGRPYAASFQPQDFRGQNPVPATAASG
jgi:hypothetical protein